MTKLLGYWVAGDTKFLADQPRGRKPANFTRAEARAAEEALARGLQGPTVVLEEPTAEGATHVVVTPEGYLLRGQRSRRMFGRVSLDKRSWHENYAKAWENEFRPVAERPRKRR